MKLLITLVLYKFYTAISIALQFYVSLRTFSLGKNSIKFIYNNSVQFTLNILKLKDIKTVKDSISHL